MNISKIKPLMKNMLKHILPYGIVRTYQKRRWRDVIKYQRNYLNTVIIDTFLKNDEYGKKYFDINGLYFPDITNNPDYINSFPYTFMDSLFFYTCLNDNYTKDIVKLMDICLLEGPYGYYDKENNFSVIVENNDIVIDAGAWIGDFSIYAFKKGAKVYAFEPTAETYKILQETLLLNKAEEIFPVRSCLGEYDHDAVLMKYNASSASNYLSDGTAHHSGKQPDATENVSVTTIDAFVKRKGIERVDFIKADIEGAERYMLRGAVETLKKFAPKLAICTYHRPDDPQVLENIILEANPAYKVIHLRHKLFACVPGKKCS